MGIPIAFIHIGIQYGWQARDGIFEHLRKSCHPGTATSFGFDADQPGNEQEINLVFDTEGVGIGHFDWNAGVIICELEAFLYKAPMARTRNHDVKFQFFKEGIPERKVSIVV
jgi:hypothetical protein